jgi:hypothetical protein
MIVVRYADDIVLGFQQRTDAERFLQEWQERLRKFGLELHPDKTRLIEFGRIAAANREQRGEGKPETFNFLGFTHICGWTRKAGKFTVMRKTIRKRLSAKLKELKEELRRRWHRALGRRSHKSWVTRARGVKGGGKLDHWGGGKLDQMSVWEMGIGREGGGWSGGLRSGVRTAFRPERKTPPSARYSAARGVAVI